MAASKMLLDVVGDVTECPICTEVIKDSTVLPCIHTFCLNCLELLWKQKKPGDKVPCPVCRMEFDIPTGGVPELPKNFFFEKLLDAQKLNMNKSDLTCDICSSLRQEKNKVVISAAEKHCLECRQNLCSHCAKMHLVTKGLEGHQLNPIGEATASEGFFNLPVKRCDLHKDKKIEIYCLECKASVCLACFCMNHSGHKCSEIEEMAEDLKKQIEADFEKGNNILQEVNDKFEKLEQILNDFVVNIQETEKTIIQRGREIKQLIDSHVIVVMQKLNFRKFEKIKELVSVKKELHLQKTNLDSFIKYSQTFFKTASLSDIVSSASQLHTRFENFHANTRKIHIGEPMTVSFHASNLELLIESCSSTSRNIIGDFSIKANMCDYVPFTENTTLVSAAEMSNLSKVAGVTISEREVFVICGNSSEIKVYDCETLTYLRNISAVEVKDPCDITFSVNILFIGETKLNLIHRIPLDSTEKMSSWSVDCYGVSLSTMESCNILVICKTASKLVEYTIAGILVREIILQPDMKCPTHAIQLDNDRFLVGHDFRWCRVSLIDNKGKTIKSYGRYGGTGPGQLYIPIRLVADLNGSCVVLDSCDPCRILMLNNKLEFVKELMPTAFRLKSPQRMCLDLGRKRLYVADIQNARVVAFDIRP